MTRRLSALLAAADDDQWRQGTFWYAVAHAGAVDLAATYDVSVECAAGVIAALSPRLPWARNMAYAGLLLATGDCPVLGASKVKARVVAAGAAPLDVLGGPKVRAFYACILSPGADGPVCVDRHAVDAALGFRGSDRSRKVLERVGAYEAVAGAYRAAGDRFGITAAQCQAIVWLVWRAAHAGRRAA
jgi:hypothetical protein